MKSIFLRQQAVAGRCALLVALIATAAGCASLDATPDIERAQTLVTARAGLAPDWIESRWDTSTDDIWDGHSALRADQAVRIALINNRDLRARITTIAASRADFVQQHLLPNPVVNLAYGFVTDGQGGDPLSIGAVSQFAWLLTRDDAIDTASAELNATILGTSDQALTLVADVLSEHANVVLDQRACDLQDSNVESTRQSVSLVRAQFDAGEATRLDLNRLELSLELATVTLRDQQTALELSRRRLLHLLGRADEASDWIASDAPLKQLDMARTIDEHDAIARASQQRIDVLAALAQVDAAAARCGLTEDQRFRMIRAGLRFDQNFANRRGVFPSLSIELPIFDDGRATIARAAAELDQAIVTAAGTRDRAVAEARHAWMSFRSEDEAVHAYESTILELAARNLELAQAAYAVGETDVSTVLDAQRRQISARLNHLTRIRARTHAAIALQRTLGGTLTPLDTLLPESNHES